MLDSKFVLENLESVRQRLGTRGRAFDLGPLVALSAEWKEVLRKVEDLRSERNRVSEEIPRMKKEGKDAAPVILAMRKVGEEITRLEAVLNEVEERLNDFLLNIPNLPHESVPVGSSAADNVEVRRSGDPPGFDFE